MASQSDCEDEVIEVEWVTSDIIRQIFNENNLANRAAEGEFITILKRDSHSDNPPKGEPYCTHSQIVFYFTKEKDLLAIVHQYLRPDGNIGASGLPDPKKLFWNNRIIAVRSAPKSTKITNG